MIATIETWELHHTKPDNVCLACGWEDRFNTWPLGTVDPDILERMRSNCITVTTKRR